MLFEFELEQFQFIGLERMETIIDDNLEMLTHVSFFHVVKIKYGFIIN